MAFGALMPEINVLNTDSKFQQSKDVVLDRDTEQMLEKVLVPFASIEGQKKGILSSLANHI